MSPSVGEAKHVRDRIEGLQAQIDKHLRKIAEEVAKPIPNEGYVNHWKKEVKVWQRDIEKLQVRLKKRRRRGS